MRLAAVLSTIMVASTPPSQGSTRGRWLYQWTADPFVFPHGMNALHDAVGLPFVQHNSWLSPDNWYKANPEEFGFESQWSGNDRAVLPLCKQLLPQRAMCSSHGDWSVAGGPDGHSNRPDATAIGRRMLWAFCLSKTPSTQHQLLRQQVSSASIPRSILM